MLCKPVYISNANKNVLIHFDAFLISLFGWWLAIVSLDIVMLILMRNSETKSIENKRIIDRMRWAHLVAVLLFATPLLFLYSNNFKLDTFCIMNKNEQICKNNWSTLKRKIDCLTMGRRKNPTIKSFIDDIGGYITIGEGLTYFEHLFHLQKNYSERTKYSKNI